MDKMINSQRIDSVKDYLLSLQSQICDELTQRDSKLKKVRDPWDRPNGGGGITCAFEDGKIFEKAGVNFSHVFGGHLPPSATNSRPDLKGASFQAMGVSLVIHPDNPFVPTSHMNVRYFEAIRDGKVLAWWFGGGFDLTPYYPFIEDVVHWHTVARESCDFPSLNKNLYTEFKEACDHYFYLKHRDETRGVGGLFFDDFNRWDFQDCFQLLKQIGDAFIPAYFFIVDKRKDSNYGMREESFQAYRRGRYVEFNLVLDRGTHFGLQSGGRTESILMSLPPKAEWRYDWHPESNSAEAELYNNYLKKQNWLKL
jgi:coproporphyrinogen III oxidase